MGENSATNLSTMLAVNFYIPPFCYLNSKASLRQFGYQYNDEGIQIDIPIYEAYKSSIFNNYQY